MAQGRLPLKIGCRREDTGGALDRENPRRMARGRQPPRTRVRNGEVMFACGYTKTLEAVSAKDGLQVWDIHLKRGLVEQWASPVVGRDCAFIGRQDGYLHKVDLNTHQLTWSVYLGDSRRAGVAVTATAAARLERRVHPAWKHGRDSGDSRRWMATDCMSARPSMLYCLENVDVLPD